MKIQFLSNVELLSRFGRLVQTERKITHLVLECIAEIDARRIYLDRAYPSLYEFLVKEYGYSSSAALRRIESARLLREIPEVSEKIESGALNLSQLSKVQQAVRTAQKLESRKLNVAEKKELLERIENTTQQQTEVILSEALSLPMMTEDKERSHRDESVTLTITFTKAQMEILKQAQDLIAHAVPEKKWAEAITYLAQKEVNRRFKIRGKKLSNLVGQLDTKTNLNVSSNSGKETGAESMAASAYSKMDAGAVGNADQSIVRDGDCNSNRTINPSNSQKENQSPSRKALPVGSRKLVLNKDRCCQYKDSRNGKICGSKRFLQIDHRQPVWAGGDNSLANLQVLCSEHNRHKYNKEAYTRYGG